MGAMVDAGVANHDCPFWRREHVPLADTTQKANSASGAGIQAHGRRASPLRFKQIPGF